MCDLEQFGLLRLIFIYSYSRKNDEGSSELARPEVEGAITRARAKRIERDTERLLLLLGVPEHMKVKEGGVHEEEDGLPGCGAHEEKGSDAHAPGDAG